MTAPLVSIVLPTYNRAKLLREALESVRAQTYTDWECIVIDDGSNDETSAIVAGIPDDRIQYQAHVHSGNPAIVRNAGIAAARGPWIAFLDDDDLWKSEKLTNQVQLLAQGEFRWSYTGFVSADQTGKVQWQTSRDRILSGSILRSLLELRAAVALPTVMVARDLLDKVGGFDENMRAREDYALWLTLAEHTDVIATPEILTVVRDHPGRRYRPESYQSSILLYKGWHDRVKDRTLRQICRHRLVDAHLREAKRCMSSRKWRAASHAIVQSLRSDAPRTVARLLAAATRVGIQGSKRARRA